MKRFEMSIAKKELKEIKPNIFHDIAGKDEIDKITLKIKKILEIS